jgi:hypothetical protein
MRLLKTHPKGDQKRAGNETQMHKEPAMSGDKGKGKDTGMIAMGILLVLAVLVLLAAISVDGMERFG